MTTPQTRQFDARREVFEELRGFVEGYCAAAGVAQATVDVLMLICEELFENSTRHGYRAAQGSASAQPIWLSLAVNGNGIDTVYEDAAPEFNPFAKVNVPDYSGPPETWRVGGLGIPLILELSRNLRYTRTDGRNRISFTVPLASGA